MDRQLWSLECLLEALYPDLFPSDQDYPQNARHYYARAIKEDGRCKALARALMQHLASIRHRTLEIADNSGRAAAFVGEVRGSSRLRRQSIELIDACTEWARSGSTATS